MSTYFKLLFILLCVSQIFATTACDENNSSDNLNSGVQDLLEDIIKCEMLEKQLQGLALTVVKNGNIIYQNSFGKASIEEDVVVTAHTPFAIASMTKIFTAISVLQLIEDGLADLDDQVGTYLIDLPNVEWKTRTIRNLLSMSSGIPKLSFCSGGEKDGEVCEDSPPFVFNPCGENSNCNSANRVPYEEYLEKAAAIPLQFDAGSEYFYSNTNFLILGKLIEALSGKSYEDYLNDNILIPLGMSETEPNTVPPPSIPNLAVGYNHTTDNQDSNVVECIFFDEPPTNCDSAPPQGVICFAIPEDNLRLPAQSFSAGWLVTTQNDMVKLEKALNKLSPVLLDVASYELMWTNTQLTNGKFERFGLGWDVCLKPSATCPQPVDPLAGGENDGLDSEETGGLEGRVVSKDGGLQGYSSEIVRYLDDGITVIIFVNILDVGKGPLQFLPATLAAEIAKTVRSNN